MTRATDFERGAPGTARHATLCPDGVDLIFADLSAAAPLLNDAEFSNRYLSPNDLSRLAGRPSRDMDGGRWRLARIALRIALERHLGAAFRGQEFDIESGGRPLVPHATLKFSYAHTSGAALIAISPAAPVGADLEALRVLHMAPGRQARVEDAGAALAPEVPLPATGVARTLQAWVRLEAAAKLYGRGIGEALTNAGIIGGGKGVAGGGGCGTPAIVYDLQVPNGYFAALAASRRPAAPSVRTFPLTRSALDAFLADRVRSEA